MKISAFAVCLPGDRCHARPCTALAGAPFETRHTNTPTKAEATETSVSIAGRPVTSGMDVDAPRLVTAALSFKASASSGTPSAIE
jgi:hypothetical protein